MIKKPAIYLGALFVGVLILIVAVYARFQSSLFRSDRNYPRLIWGSTPILNYSIWAKAMKQAGYSSNSMVSHYYSSINSDKDWDFIALNKLCWLPSLARPPIAFMLGLVRGDVFIISFDGFFLGNSPLRWFQAFFFKIAKKKTVVVPYGSDAFEYRSVRATSLQHALMLSYPAYSMRQNEIRKKVDYWVKNADVLIPGMMGYEGIGRWDVLAPSILSLDLDVWTENKNWNQANGVDGEVNIVHAPNHKGFKGSEFIEQAVNSLRKKGLRINYILLENMQNDQVREILQTKADILVEQIHAIGHGLNGLEGMASSVPTISNLTDPRYVQPMVTWSFLGECPIVSTNTGTLEHNLEILVSNPTLRKEIGKKSRQYVEKYHGKDATTFLFSSILESFENETINLLELYHPIKGSYKINEAKISNSWKDMFE